MLGMILRLKDYAVFLWFLLILGFLPCGVLLKCVAQHIT